MKLNLTLGDRINSEIAADLDPAAGMKQTSLLPDKNVSGDDLFTAEFFYTQSSAVTVSLLSGRTTCFCMCHMAVI
jgi:hypothetical protein